MQRLMLPAFLALAAVAGAVLAQAGSNQATIVVRLPADATLVVGSQQTAQRGSERRLVTPQLEPGYTYSYQVEARWTEAGKEVKQVRTIEIQAGRTAVVDFFARDPATTKKAEAPKPQAVQKQAEPKPQAKPKVDVAPVEPKPQPKKLDVVPLEPKKSPAPGVKGDAKTRTFVFSYSGVVKDLKPGETAKIWLPVPETTEEQTIALDSIEAPAQRQMNEEKQYGNRILFFEDKANAAGEIPFKVTYKVTRKEVKTDVKAGATLKPREGKESIARFLQPDAKVPVSGKPLDLLKENLKGKGLPPDQFETAKVLYEVVNNHMKYSKEGTGWGQGDSVWACDSKFGNCTDFHSLFISMARGNKIPSKFEMGFPIPPKRGSGPVGGYHCWAWFMPQGKGWVPVDISEANRFPEMRDYYFGNLTEDRVQFTTGRDINLVPRQDGPALNFFIYPYVEVNGTPYPADKVQRTFAYQDI